MGEAAFERGFPISESVVDRVVAGFDQLDNLVDAEQRIGIEENVEKYFARCETAVRERCIAHVGEGVSTVATPDKGTVVPRLDSSVTTLRTRSAFPRLLTAPLDDRVEWLGGVQIRMKCEAVRFLSDLCPKTTASTVV